MRRVHCSWLALVVVGGCSPTPQPTGCVDGWCGVGLDASPFTYSDAFSRGDGLAPSDAADADDAAPADAPREDTGTDAGAPGRGELPLVSDASWRATTSFASEDWFPASYDDSAWPLAASPSRFGCGWVYEPAGGNWWEHADTVTMSCTASKSPATCTLRREVVVPEGTTLQEAIVTTVTDDDHRLFVNGNVVATDADGRGGPVITTDIRPFLHAGTNVIMLELVDRGGCSWAVVDGAIRWSGPAP